MCVRSFAIVRYVLRKPQALFEKGNNNLNNNNNNRRSALGAFPGSKRSGERLERSGVWHVLSELLRFCAFVQKCSIYRSIDTRKLRCCKFVFLQLQKPLQNKTTNDYKQGGRKQFYKPSLKCFKHTIIPSQLTGPLGVTCLSDPLWPRLCQN